MLIGLFQRLFGTTRDVTALPYFDAGNRAVEISATMLRECIDLGFGGADGPNRERLTKPFSRGYIFGFSDACIQRFGVLDELELLALITEVHAKIFGHKIGSLLIGDALRDQHNAEFRRGQIAGAEDLLRWLNDRSYTPLLLTRFLQADDATSCPMVPTGVSPAESDIEASDVPTMHAPLGWNTTPVGKKAIAEATPNKSAVVIRLHTRRPVRTVKRIERDGY
jgi:hypothetical protein